MPKVKKSKREKEAIRFESEAKWLQPIPAENTMDNELPTEIVDKLDKSVNATSGYVRCLDSRIIFKQRESTLSSKPRLMNIPYQNVQQYFIESRHPKAVILNVYKENLDAHKWHEVLMFKKKEDAAKFADELDKRTAENQYAHQDTYSEVPTRTQSEQVVFSDRAKIRQYDMSRHSRFPDALPGSVIDSLRDRNLDNEGELNAYPSQVVFREPNRPSSEHFLKVHFDDVEKIYYIDDDKQHAVLAVNRANQTPSNYTLVRFERQDSLPKLKSLYERQGGQIVNRRVDENYYEGDRTTYAPSSRIIHHEDDYFDRLSTSRPVSRSYMEPTQRAYTSQGGRDRGFEVSNITQGVHRSFSRISNAAPQNKSDMMNFPDDEEWESALTYINSSNPGGIEVGDEGSVYMFVAHKVK